VASLKARQVKVEAGKSAGKVSGLLLVPEDARFLLVFAHGAGAGMRHRFMEVTARNLAVDGIGTLRYQFPYIENGLRRPDPKPILLATVRAAVERAASLAEGLPLFAGGKSMGGRMTSTAASEGLLPDIKGLVFFGFPLHPPGKPSVERAEHLGNVNVPMLFLQGTRDTLADLTLLRPVVERLGARATLHIVETADHSFSVLKSSGLANDVVLTDLSRIVAAWFKGISQKSAQTAQKRGI
jgi:predicted alpha/beta-hydrolase family hydrolase